MPILPSGRRIDYSLDRFHAWLARMTLPQAQKTIANLTEPDDLLHVLDVVFHDPFTGKPFYANRVAADFSSYAACWSQSDQDALAVWIRSEAATCHRAAAIAGIHAMVAEVADCQVKMPHFA